MATSQLCVALVKYCSNLVIPVHANQPYSGVLLASSALFWCHAVSFQYIPVPFLFIPTHSGVIRLYSRVFSALFQHILVYSGTFCSIPFGSCV